MMSPHTATAREEALTKAVLDASAVCRIIQPVAKKQGIRKPDGSHVTAADLANQVLLLDVISNHWPDEQVFAEESTSSLDGKQLGGFVREVLEEVAQRSWGESEIAELLDYRGNKENRDAVWYVDPIDGTGAFRRGEHYAVALARAESGSLTHSWLAAPGGKPDVAGVNGYLFKSVKGAGAERISLESDTSEPLSPPEISADRVTIAATWAQKSVDPPKELKRGSIPLHLLSMSSESKYAALAIGAAQLYPRKPSRFRGPFYRWDHAAGVLLLEEMGGVATDLAGDSLTWTAEERFPHNSGLFAATSKALHNEYQPKFAARAAKLLK